MSQPPSPVLGDVFALRTPLLPFQTLVTWNASHGSPSALRKYLQAWVEEPVVREAIFLASPRLVTELDEWLRDPKTRRGRKIERALVGYFVRMIGRPTPFGALAGTSLGFFGETTKLRLKDRTHYRRFVTLDAHLVEDVRAAVVANPAFRGVLTYAPNDGFFTVGGRHKYTVRQPVRDGRWRWQAVELEASPFIERCLRLASNGILRDDLINALVADTVPQSDEAASIVDQLIDFGLLVPTLGPALCSADPVGDWIERLHSIAPQVGRELIGVRDCLQALRNEPLGVDIDVYAEVTRRLSSVPGATAQVEHTGRVFRTHLSKPGALTLGPRIQAELGRGVEILRHVTTPSDSLASFRAGFLARYGRAEVSLPVVLDDEWGIGLDGRSRGASRYSPVLALADDHSGTEASSHPFEPRHAALLRHIVVAERNGDLQIHLSKAELRALSVPSPMPFPHSFAAQATLVAKNAAAMDRGQFELCIHAVHGPPAELFFARFCEGNPEWTEAVKSMAAAETDGQRACVFAEVVCEVSPRLNNVAYRPQLRDYEIVYFGGSGASEEERIGITDLMVSVSGDRVRLRSIRLNKEVIPRVSIAQQYWTGGLALYQFLCAVQGEGRPRVFAFDWGLFADLPFLPRLQRGRIIIAPARWRVTSAELTHLDDLRDDRKLPRYVCLVDGLGAGLPIDLDNELCRELLFHRAKQHGHVDLSEFLGAAGKSALGECLSSPVESDEGRFVNEIVVPFHCRVREDDSYRAALTAPTEVTRSFKPGTDWVYLRMFAGSGLVDEFLRQDLAAVVRRARDAGLIDSWFFIRYYEPRFHLRLRFRAPANGGDALLTRLLDEVGRTRHGAHFASLEVATYEREIEKYGGGDAISHVEAMFEADSDAVLAMLAAEAGELQARWRWGLAGLGAIAADLGLDDTASLLVTERARNRFARRPWTTSERRTIGRVWRESFSKTTGIADKLDEDDTQAGEALRLRSTKWRRPVAALKALEAAGKLSRPLSYICEDLFHMYLNRLLASTHRHQELILYDFSARRLHRRLALWARGPTGTTLSEQ